ncbi:MAG: UbiH/UbiF family hydroxylase [Xanthobacteraceae bacterium]|nr:UbiH/UbiF family hydroxylase [Xanthobacteraceae bacterium]
MNDIQSEFGVVIVGGGPVGLATAIGIAQSGVSTSLVARRAAYNDNRTSALLGGSIDFLRSLGVWEACEQHAAPLQTMRLIDDTGRLIRAPEVRFTSDEIGQENFGYNIENRILVEALEQRASGLQGLIRFDDEAASIEPAASHVDVVTQQGGALKARVVGGADGRQSLARRSANIGVREQTLKQSALTFNVSHTRPHHSISTEFHTPNGPCVFVPLPGQNSSVVWVTTSERAAQLRGLTDQELGDAAERQSHSILGKMTAEGDRHIFPLTIQTPHAFAARRIALLGESAHVFPPIGAQGLNLGLRDAADFIRIVSNAFHAGVDAGSDTILSQYALARRLDITTRSATIEIANLSLLSDFLPVHSLRAAGLQLLSAVGPLRKLAMREGLSPWWRRAG